MGNIREWIDGAGQIQRGKSPEGTGRLARAFKSEENFS